MPTLKYEPYWKGTDNMMLFNMGHKIAGVLDYVEGRWLFDGHIEDCVNCYIKSLYTRITIATEHDDLVVTVDEFEDYDVIELGDKPDLGKLTYNAGTWEITCQGGDQAPAFFERLIEKLANYKPLPGYKYKTPKKPKAPEYLVDKAKKAIEDSEQ